MDSATRKYQATFVVRGPDALQLVRRAKGLISSEHGPITLRPMGDELQIVMTCNASTLDEARRKVQQSAEQFVALMALKTGVSFDLIFGGLENTSEGVGESELSDLLIQWDELPDLSDRIAADAQDAAELTDILARRAAEGTTSLFDKSLDYFDRALFFRRQVLKLADPRRRRGTHVAIEVILNFYKAVAILLGDPIDNEVAQSLALSREDKKRVDRNLYELRHRHDVAHETVKYIDIEEQMPAAWEIARYILTQYGTAVHEGRNVPPPR